MIIFFFKYFFSLSRFYKKIIILCIDIFISVISINLSIIILKKSLHIGYDLEYFILLVYSLFFIPLFILFDTYNIIFRFLNFKEVLKILYATIIYSFLLIVLYNFSDIEDYSLNTIYIYILIFFLLILSFRLLIIFSKNFIQNKIIKKNVIIYGAGEIGFQILNNFKDFKVIAYLDDDLNKENTKLNNIRVFNPREIKNLLNKYVIDTILVAIKNLDLFERKKIINQFNSFNVAIKFLPFVNNNNFDNITLSDFNNINPEELIERTVVWDKYKINNFYKDSIVCITGAGGSIGSEITKQLFNSNVKKIIIVDHSELNLFNIDNFLKKNLSSSNSNIEIIKILGSILDDEILDKIFSFKPTSIFHAAAYKHVNMLELNPKSGVKNNILGTIKLVDKSIKNNLPRFVFISSDKAVSPSSIMGATKRIGEKYIESLNLQHNTNFSIVRFGNVIGSSGSVFHLFKSQIQSLSPITITHKDVTRYFMSIQEAVGLVIEASLIETDDVVFVLNMGEPIKILDLAKKMIKLSGLTIKEPNNNRGDIEIKYIGLSQGEKMHEKLKINSQFYSTSHPDIFSIKSNSNHIIEAQIIKKTFTNLLNENNIEKIKLVLNDFVEGNMLIKNKNE